MNSEIKRTYTDMVREALADKTPIWRLWSTTNLSRRQVSSIVRRLKENGELLSTGQLQDISGKIQEPRRFAMREQSPLIEPYAQIGMTALEVQEALYFERGIYLTDSQAREAVNKSRSRGKVRQLTDEEKRDSALNSHVTRDEVRDNARLWVAASILTKEQGIDTRGWTRLDWKNWMTDNESLTRKKVETIAQGKKEKRERLLTLRGVSPEDIALLSGDEDFDAVDTEERNRIVFVRQVIKAGLITDDMRFLTITKAIADTARRGWVDDPIMSLIMESYVVAKAHELKGDEAKSEHYRKIGESIDRKWFNGAGLSQEREIVNRMIANLSRMFSE